MSVPEALSGFLRVNAFTPLVGFVAMSFICTLVIEQSLLPSLD